MEVRGSSHYFHHFHAEQASTICHDNLLCVFKAATTELAYKAQEFAFRAFCWRHAAHPSSVSRNALATRCPLVEHVQDFIPP